MVADMEANAEQKRADVAPCHGSGVMATQSFSKLNQANVVHTSPLLQLLLLVLPLLLQPGELLLLL